jgi:hypothetical protein
MQIHNKSTTFRQIHNFSTNQLQIETVEYGFRLVHNKSKSCTNPQQIHNKSNKCCLSFCACVCVCVCVHCASRPSIRVRYWRNFYQILASPEDATYSKFVRIRCVLKNLKTVMVQAGSCDNGTQPFQCCLLRMQSTTAAARPAGPANRWL